MSEIAGSSSLLPVTAVSLGSNGFHLVSAVRDGDSLQFRGHLHENVQVESYLDENMLISPIGQERILKALGRFARHLKENPSALVAAIATGSFRKAKNTESFIKDASHQLGYPIQVLSGQDESLLCYMGIASSVGLSDQNRLVIDIGGGSTELMIANKNELIQYCSIDIGCVSLTRDVLRNEKINRQDLERAVQIVSETINPSIKSFLELGWHEVMGCGGTVSSLFAILQARRMGGRFITTAGLDRFTSVILETGSAIETAGTIVTQERAKLLPAGASILMGIYKQLGIEKIQPVFSSVGQGVLVELAKQQQGRRTSAK